MLYIFLIATLFFSCRKEKEETEGVLVRYGDRELTYDEVESKLPAGLLSSDREALFHRIIDSWIKDAVLSELAEERLYDLDLIERKVRDYRNALIVQEYLSRMRESHSPQVDEVKVKEYYDKHRNELKLEVPLVKGIFMKTDIDAQGKDNIRTMLSSDEEAMIDRLEQEWLDRALEYNYFRDKWIDWDTLTGMIPYKFGNPDEFVKENKVFSTDYGDCSYYLKITDYLPSGEEQPYEFAATWISNLLTQGELADYEDALVASIVANSMKNKKLEAIGYDPLKHELKENNVTKEDE